MGGGKQAAKALSEAIHGEGEILVLQGKTGSSASRERGKGFDEGLKDSPNIKVVTKQEISEQKKAIVLKPDIGRPFA